MNNLEIISKINLIKLSILNNLSLKDFFPKIKDKIYLSNNNLEIEYKKEKLSIIKREYDIRIKNLNLEEEAIIKSFPLGYQNVVKELVKLKGENSQLYSSELTDELFRLEAEFKEKKAQLALLKEK